MALGTLGGTPVAMGSIDLSPPRREEDDDGRPACFACDTKARKLVRFDLEHRRPGAGGRGRKAGELLLCEACWQRCNPPPIEVADHRPDLAAFAAALQQHVRLGGRITPAAIRSCALTGRVEVVHG